MRHSPYNLSVQKKLKRRNLTFALPKTQQLFLHWILPGDRKKGKLFLKIFNSKELTLHESIPFLLPIQEEQIKYVWRKKTKVPEILFYCKVKLHVISPAHLQGKKYIDFFFPFQCFFSVDILLDNQNTSDYGPVNQLVSRKYTEESKKVTLALWFNLKDLYQDPFMNCHVFGPTDEKSCRLSFNGTYYSMRWGRG